MQLTVRSRGYAAKVRGSVSVPDSSIVPQICFEKAGACALEGTINGTKKSMGML
jgi:hypothetical protein